MNLEGRCLISAYIEGAREWEQIFQANYMTYIMGMYLKYIQNGRLPI